MQSQNRKRQHEDMFWLAMLFGSTSRRFRRPLHGLCVYGNQSTLCLTRPYIHAALYRSATQRGSTAEEQHYTGAVSRHCVCPTQEQLQAQSCTHSMGNMHGSQGRKNPAMSASGSNATKHPETPSTAKLSTKAGGRSTCGSRW